MADISASVHKIWTLVTSEMKAELSPFRATVTVHNPRNVIRNENGN